MLTESSTRRRPPAAMRGSFVIDKEGMVCWTVVNALPDARDLNDYVRARTRPPPRQPRRLRVERRGHACRPFSVGGSATSGRVLIPRPVTGPQLIGPDVLGQSHVVCRVAKYSSVIEGLAEDQADLLIERGRIDELRTRTDTVPARNRVEGRGPRRQTLALDHWARSLWRVLCHTSDHVVSLSRAGTATWLPWNRSNDSCLHSGSHEWCFRHPGRVPFRSTPAVGTACTARQKLAELSFQWR